MYDIIGDIHGYSYPLENLLRSMRYREVDGIYRHPTRRVIFLGDFIDRGPRIGRVLQVARRMVEAGSAFAVLGNHELNALAFHTKDPDSNGDYLRPHNAKNIHQHRATLGQLTSSELKDYLAWFRTLPLWLEIDGIRVVHACWDADQMKQITDSGLIDDGIGDAFLQRAFAKHDPLFVATEIVLKGKELDLPNGMSFKDKDGHDRTSIRTRWYLNSQNVSYRNYALQADVVECNALVSSTYQPTDYPLDAPPVFFGHYWLSEPKPIILAPNVACLDFSVAKHGYLACYRWDGESQLQDSSFLTSDRNLTAGPPYYRHSKNEGFKAGDEFLVEYRGHIDRAKLLPAVQETAREFVFDSVVQHIAELRATLEAYADRSNWREKSFECEAGAGSKLAAKVLEMPLEFEYVD